MKFNNHRLIFLLTLPVILLVLLSAFTGPAAGEESTIDVDSLKEVSPTGADTTASPEPAPVVSSTAEAVKETVKTEDTSEPLMNREALVSETPAEPSPSKAEEEPAASGSIDNKKIFYTDDNKSEDPGREKPGWNEDPNRGKPEINLGRILVGLLVMSVLTYLGLMFYGKMTGTGMAAITSKSKLMSVRERHSISPGKQLLIVDLPGKTVLLGISENDMRILTEIDPDKIEETSPVSADGKEQPSGFSYLTDIFRRQWGRDK